MKLTPKERASIYRKVKKILKPWPSAKDSFCSIFMYWIYPNYNIYENKNLKRLFPEMYQLKPKKKDWHGEYWFKTDREGTKKRKELLTEAIKLTKTAIK